MLRDTALGQLDEAVHTQPPAAKKEGTPRSIRPQRPWRPQNSEGHPARHGGEHRSPPENRAENHTKLAAPLARPEENTVPRQRTVPHTELPQARQPQGPLKAPQVP